MTRVAWCGVIAVTALGAVSPSLGQPAKPQATENVELARMFKEDQDDRKPGLHGIDWAVVKPRDDVRLARVRELYATNALHTGADWLHAALILQHGNEPDDYLLAHEMCVAALAEGEQGAKWLVAASEDRFLMGIGRKQRFGTQYEPASEAGKFRLAPVDSRVADGLRVALGAPPLAHARATEGRFDKK